MVDGPAQWLRLIQSARPADRPTAVRAAGRHPSPPITAALIDRLGDDDPQTAAAAALALGAPAHAAAVASLARSLVEGDERLRMAAIRGLGGIATPAARRALEDTAGSHPDPATRRRAGAEASRLARR